MLKHSLNNHLHTDRVDENPKMLILYEQSLGVWKTRIYWCQYLGQLDCQELYLIC